VFGVNGVMLTASAAENLGRYARDSSDGLETGGILLGNDHGLGGDFVVTLCGDAGSAAVRRRNRFRRDVAHAQRLADEAFDRDGSAWIGEWHTHVVGDEVPSKADVRTYRGLLEDPDAQLNRLLTIIVRPHEEDGWCQPAMFAWSFTGTVLRQLSVSIEDAGDPT
jgi:integrative and conjugative element protein (TIGR02256 family)